MFWQAVGALTPMVLTALLFWYVMRVIISADRRERLAMAEFDRQQAELAQQTAPADSSENPTD